MNAYTELAFALSSIKNASKADKLLRAGKLLPSSVARLLDYNKLPRSLSAFMSPAMEPLQKMQDAARTFQPPSFLQRLFKTAPTSPSYPDVDWRDALPLIREGRNTPISPWASMTPNVKSPNRDVQELVNLSRRVRGNKIPERSIPSKMITAESPTYNSDTHTINLNKDSDRNTAGHELGHAIGWQLPTFQRAQRLRDATTYLKQNAPTTATALGKVENTNDFDKYMSELEAQFHATKSPATGAMRAKLHVDQYPVSKFLHPAQKQAILEADTNDLTGRAGSLVRQLIGNYKMPIR